MRGWLLVTGSLLLAACGASEQQVAPPPGEKLNVFDEEEPGAEAPRIAYAYSYRYTLARERIGAAQERHLALCRALGQRRCLVLQTELTRGDDHASASTRMLVDARVAVAFGRRLDGAVAAEGGEQETRSVSAEDVTKQLVDTGARIRAKEALAARLLALINGARGDVADLVAAEKAFAEAQEELDAARTLQASLQRRVAMSEVTVSYGARSDAGTLAPVKRALADSGKDFVSSLAAAITFAIAAIPWLVIGLPAIAGLRALWRWRRRRGDVRG